MNYFSRFANIKSLFGLLVLLPVFLFCQIWLHQEIQFLLFFITRRMNIVFILFSIVFFPGIFLHEVSHFLTAKILGVKTGKFSIAPRRLDSTQLQLGFVEIAKTDVFRDAIIGVAPLITGIIVVAYIGLVHLDLSTLWFFIWNRNFSDSLAIVAKTYNATDFWIWFYLIIVISGAMFPSKSDRRAWLPIFLFTMMLLGLSWFAGGGLWMKLHLLPLINQACESISAVFLISIVAYMVIVIPLFLVRQLFLRRNKHTEP